MKKLLVLIIAIMCSNLINAQDTLIKKDGDYVSAKVLEVLPNEIKYKRFDNLEGPTVTILKSDVFMIRYENGTRDVFDNQEDIVQTEPEGTSKTAGDLYLQGRIDANKYYRKSGPFLGSCITTFLFLPIGLATATIVSLTPPKPENLQAPDVSLMKNNSYYSGYLKKAKSKKAGNAWLGVAAGVGGLLILNLALIR